MRKPRRSVADEMTYFLGGRRALGASIESLETCVGLVSTGLPRESLHALQKRAGLSNRLFHTVLPRTTLQGKGSGSVRLTSRQSDRAVRLARVLAFATATFGDRDRARKWLSTENPALDRKPPAALLATEAGARYVEEWLGRIAHGIAA